MLVNLNEILRKAEGGRYAIGCFNTPNPETVQAVLAAAEEEAMPVILAHAQSMDPPAVLGEIAPVMLSWARAASVPVCVHLDHGTDWDYITRAMDAGFTSVMFDLSAKPFEENAGQLARLCRLAHSRQISVEAELGVLQAGIPSAGSCAYTDPQQAARFALLTGVDALTVCFGTAHGRYAAPPRLDIGRVERIRRLLDPGYRLVMHGASGVDDAQVRAAIKAGVSKINYYSGLSRGCSRHIYGRLTACGGNMHWHQIHDEAFRFMKEHAREKIRLFAGRDAAL